MTPQEVLHFLPLAQIEDDVRRHFKCDGHFGNIRTELFGVAQGFVSEMLLFFPDWSVPDVVPERFAIKVLRHLPGGRATGTNFDDVLSGSELNRLESITRLHNTEVEVLKFLSPVIGLAIPEVISSSQMGGAESLGYLMMKYVAGCANLHMCDNIPEHALNQVMQVLAKIQAVGMTMPEELKTRLGRKYFSQIAVMLFEKSTVSKFCDNFRQIDLPRWPEATQKLLDALESIDDLVKFADNTSDALGMEKVLCHGDVWMCNMLWLNDDPDNWQLEALVDFQAAYVGNPANDLARLFTGCLSGEERRSRGPEYIKRFYGYLTTELGPTNLPYTLDQLVESYRRLLPLCAYVVAGSIVTVGELIVSKSDDPQKAQEVLLEKQRCLIEDIVEGAQYCRNVISGSNKN